MQGKTENIRHCFKMNKKIFPLFITENIQLTTPENTITYHNTLCLSPQTFAFSIVFSFSWELN